MKTLITIILLTVTTLTAQLEFEKVLQLYPEDGANYSNQIYLNGDSVYVVSSYNNKPRGFFLSTNSGETWEDLLMRENLRLGDDTPNYTTFNPFRFHFIEINNDDLTFSVYNFDGDLISENKFEETPPKGIIIFNPNDPNFIGILRQHRVPQFNVYDDSFYYTVDYGNTWQKLDAYNLAVEHSGISLFPQKEIQFLPNIRNPEKSLFRLIWHTKTTSIYHFTFNYNFHTHEARFYEDYLQQKYSNYGTYSEDEVASVTDKDSIIHFNMETGEKYGYSRIGATMGWDPDSIAQNNDDGFPAQYSQIIRLDKFKVNPDNPDHQLVMYKHAEGIDGQEPPMSYIDQYIFQSFDAGQTWESVAQSFDRFNPIVDIYINSKDATLWIKKNAENGARGFNVNDHYSVLYKSTSPLTNVSEIESPINSISAMFLDNYLIIESDELIGEGTVNLYNIEGKIVLESNQFINRGRTNYCKINSEQVKDNFHQSE